MPGVYFQLIGKSPTLANSYKFRSVEIKQTAFHLDGVLVPNIMFGRVSYNKI
ncbi:MAG: DUF2887 domain-containing protein [Okeania sp. SIO2D1]|nr:DUF2887 domain-containing protein [Okeania sp. SIO2D1]